MSPGLVNSTYELTRTLFPASSTAKAFVIDIIPPYNKKKV